jgi:thermitase
MFEIRIHRLLPIISLLTLIVFQVNILPADGFSSNPPGRGTGEPDLQQRVGINPPTTPYTEDVVIIGLKPGISMSVNGAPISRINIPSSSSSLSYKLISLQTLSIEKVFPFTQTSISVPQNDKTQIGLSQIYRLQLIPGSDVVTAINLLSSDPAVLFAEPDYIAIKSTDSSSPTETALHPSLLVNDPLYSQQWGLSKINIENAWQFTTGSTTTVIALIDSGIDLTHPDLSSQLWLNPGEIPANGLDDDNNGYIDDINGWNFVTSTNDISDDNGHGTLVAGVVAARTGNSLGIAGVCPQCRLMSVKVMSAGGTANYSDIAAGILYAAQKGAKVINLSLGGYADSNTLRNTINSVVSDYGVVIVAGSGNDNLNQPFYPAAYDTVLAVAGTQSDDIKTGVSNYGNWVDVSAPADAILTTALGGDWVNGSGTSVAAPFASGLAGLLRTLNPDWNQATIRSQIVHTTDSIDSANPAFIDLVGSGRLNAGTTIQAPHPLISIGGFITNGVVNGRASLGTTSQLYLTLVNDWWDAFGVTATLTTTDPTVSIINGTTNYNDIPATTSKTNNPTFTFSVDSGAGYNHPIPFTLAVADTSGYSAYLNFTIDTETGVVNKSGTLTTQNWTNDLTYIITNNISVPTGNILTIQPGTVIKFSGNYTLSVRGTLIADGTSSQPIQFVSETGTNWDRIFFDDLNIDAQADVSGNYLSGSILRHVSIEGNTGGITCTTSTPYLSHVNTDNGGINCTVGATHLWLQDSIITGDVNIMGPASAYRSTVYGGLRITGSGSSEDNDIRGSLSLGSGNARRNTIQYGGLTVSGSSGTIEENSISGGNISAGESFQVLNNTVTGSLTTGSNSTVDHNTVSNGIIVGDSTIVTWNTATDGDGIGLAAGTDLTAQYNRLIGNATGITATTGLIEHNLIANSLGVGMQVGAASVRYNTFTGNKGNTILLQGGIPVTFDHNNLEGNTGTFDLYVDIPNPPGTPAHIENNWWGTTSTTVIDERIYDWYDDDLKTTAVYYPALSLSEQTSPGYVTHATVTPDPVGIQSGVFEVEFNRPMDENFTPSLEFYDNSDGSWSSLQLPEGTAVVCGGWTQKIFDMAVDLDGTKWIAVWNGVYHYDGITWQLYSTPFPGDGNGSCTPVYSIAIEPNGVKWFGTYNGVVRFDGETWTTYTIDTITYNMFNDIAISPDGTKWFVTHWAIASYDDTNWEIFTRESLGLPEGCSFTKIAVESNGAPWVGSENCGLLSYDGTNWRQYTTNNSGFIGTTVDALTIDQNNVKWIATNGEMNSICKDPIDGEYGDCRFSFDGITWGNFVSFFGEDDINAIQVDKNNDKWFGGSNWRIITSGPVSKFNDKKWVFYTAVNSGFSFHSIVKSILSLADGTMWFGLDRGKGIVIRHAVKHYPVVQNGEWVTPTTYRATYDFTSDIPRSTYRVSITDAIDPDGLKMALNAADLFIVDYAGSISDKTPPIIPLVAAMGDGSLTNLSASWSSSDPESIITQYRYAIGTTPGGRDVVDWTFTTTTAMSRNNLNLTYGIPYYVSVGARNEGGLWSGNGISHAIYAGLAATYLPMVIH